MNLVDVVILVMIAVAIAHGLRQGAAVQVLGFGGFWGGLFLGALIGPFVSKMVSGELTKILVSLFVVFGLASIAGGVGRQIGVHVWGRLRKLKLGVADTVAGAGIAVLATLFAVWIMASMLSSIPVQDVARGIHRSKIIRAITGLMPPAPSVIAQMRRILSAANFPDVFAGLEPTPERDVPLPDDPAVRAAASADRASTVKVVGVGCGGLVTGSGFVAQPNLVVTNAHVISGTKSITVQDQGGIHRAVPVFFDPDFDMAVLRVQGLKGASLRLIDKITPRGSGAAVLGYPGGGGFTAVAGVELSEFNAVGRDIYGKKLVKRSVYQLKSQVKHGNSGGPFVQRNGDVVGVVFAASVTQSDVGYALIGPDVTSRLKKVQPNAVDTQQCTS